MSGLNIELVDLFVVHHYFYPDFGTCAWRCRCGDELAATGTTSRPEVDRLWRDHLTALLAAQATGPGALAAELYDEGHTQGVIDAQRRHCRHDDPMMRLLWVLEVERTEPNPYAARREAAAVLPLRDGPGCCDPTCTEAHP